MKKSFHLRQLLFAGGAFAGRNICGKLSGSPGYSIFDHLDHLDIRYLITCNPESRWMFSFKRGDNEQKMLFVCQQGRGYDCWKLEKHSHPGMVVELPLPHLLQQEQLRKENRDPGFCLRFDLFNF